MNIIFQNTHLTLHILPNISQIKGNRAMKFGQLMEHQRNVLLQKSCRKFGREASPRALFVF